MRDYWLRRHRSVAGLRAVGCLDRSEADNQAEYAEAAAELGAALGRDVPDPAAAAVLDIGYGQGHYARLAAELGFATYVGLDFAAPPPSPPVPRSGYTFLNRDACEPRLALARRFEVVLLIDVAFHVVAEQRFQALVDNVARHAGRFVYVTGLFEDIALAKHVRHRPLDVWAGLGEVVDVRPWRDTRIATIVASGRPEVRRLVASRTR